MFTGIIETLGQVASIATESNNLSITIDSSFTNELKIDQSVAHNGICLTVVGISGSQYVVTAVQETIDKTTIGDWIEGEIVNLERGMKLGDRLDGHIVQGHIDQIGICTNIEDAGGSTYFTFKYDGNVGNLTIEKGSITVNGVSLTVVNSKEDEFSVAIIPYTIEHTNFQKFEIGTKVNLEFDVIGKYVAKLQKYRQ